MIFKITDFQLKILLKMRILITNSPKAKILCKYKKFKTRDLRKNLLNNILKKTKQDSKDKILVNILDKILLVLFKMFNKVFRRNFNVQKVSIF